MGHARYARHVGRIGALAVALGIGSAVATPAGIAWATPDGSVDSPAPAPASTNAESGPDASTKPGTASADDAPAGSPSGSVGTVSSPPSAGATTGSATTEEVAPGVTLSSSGGAHSSTDRQDVRADRAANAKPTKPRKAPRARAIGAASPDPAPRPPAAAGRADVAVAAKAPSAEPPVARAVVSVAAPDSSTGTTAAKATTAVGPVFATAAPATIATLVRGVLAPALSSVFGVLPGSPVESPLAGVVLAAARRQAGLQTTSTAAVERAAVSATTTAAAANLAPAATPVVDYIDAITGTVTGRLVGSDPEAKKVTYALTAKPLAGSLTFNATTAAYTYVPTAAQRVLASVSTAATTIAMTVTVSDGVNRVPVTVAIPISAAPITAGPIVGVPDAGAVAASATRVYVANRGAGTVTVLDAVTGSIVTTIAVGPTPDDLALKPDGTRLYVASSSGNAITVIDTATGAVKATIAVAKPSALTVNPSGSVLYVANADGATVTKISTSTNKITGTVKLPTGVAAEAIAVSPDSTKVYVIGAKQAGGTTVSVFTSSGTTATPVLDLTSAATALVVSPDNAKLYVGAADGYVTVIDTKTKAVLRTVAVGGVPAGVATSRDGTVLVVNDAAGQVAASDAANGTALSALSPPQTSDVLGVVMSPDRTQLVITGSNGVRFVSLVPPNTAPTVGTPTTAVPNATTGALTESVGVTDPNLDRLTYAVTTIPAKGKVTVNANGTFTYTPTAAARHVAAAVGAQVGDTTDAFAVTVSDGRGGVVTATITVDVLPANRLPTAVKTVGTPSAATGVVTGSVKGADIDKDLLVYSQTNPPAKGSVVVNANGTFTYQPSVQARHAAAKVGATAADKVDTFTISVSNGHGGVVPVSLTVAISPANAKPTGAGVANAHIGLNDGVVTGTITAVDVDGDVLAFRSSAPKKGTLVLRADGSFTYTPTAAARLPPPDWRHRRQMRPRAQGPTPSRSRCQTATAVRPRSPSPFPSPRTGTSTSTPPIRVTWWVTRRMPSERWSDGWAPTTPTAMCSPTGSRRPRPRGSSSSTRSTAGSSTPPTSRLGTAPHSRRGTTPTPSPSASPTGTAAPPPPR